MYDRIWIQCLWRAYESCSVAHEAKMADFPGLKTPDQLLLFLIMGPGGHAPYRLFFFVCVHVPASDPVFSDPGSRPFLLHAPLSSFHRNERIGGPPKTLYPDSIIHPRG